MKHIESRMSLPPTPCFRWPPDERHAGAVHGGGRVGTVLCWGGRWNPGDRTRGPHTRARGAVCGVIFRREPEARGALVAGTELPQRRRSGRCSGGRPSRVVGVGGDVSSADPVPTDGASCAWVADRRRASGARSSPRAPSRHGLDRSTCVPMVRPGDGGRPVARSGALRRGMTAGSFRAAVATHDQTLGSTSAPVDRKVPGAPR